MEEKTQYPKFLPELIRDYVLTPNFYADCMKEMLAKTMTGTMFLKPLKNTKMLGLSKVILEFLNNKKILIKNRDFEEIFAGFVKGQGIIPLSVIAPYLKQKDSKIYTLQKSFFEKFKKVNFKMIQYKHLPKEAMGFVQFPEPIKDRFSKKNYTSFFYFCGHLENIHNEHFIMQQERTYDINEDSINVLAVAFFDEEYELYFEWRYFPLDLNMTVEESFKNITRSEVTDNGIKTTIIPEGYDDNLAIMVNTIAYLHSGDPDIRTIKNRIRYQSPTSQTPIKADKHLSLSNIIEVGFNYKKDRLQYTDEWHSMAHMGWRRCGTLKSQIKLVLVKGSTKSWKKKEQKANQEI